ncbi:MAG: hypothetical protein U9Q90_02865 [Campylobacterota bacterium]|nr:hypothetical protein [Campylobacterota bacterium]
MRNTLLFLLTVVTIGLMPLSANEPSNTSAVKAAQVQPAKVPSFDFATIEGKKIEIVETADGFKFPTLKDKNIIIMFYIYSGKPCRNELKIFTKIKTKHSDLEFVTFELKGLTPEKLKDFQNELDLKGLHMIDTQQALPFANYIAGRVQWQGSVPLLIIADKNGVVKHLQLGAMSEDEIENALKKL